MGNQFINIRDAKLTGEAAELVLKRKHDLEKEDGHCPMNRGKVVNILLKEYAQKLKNKFHITDLPKNREIYSFREIKIGDEVIIPKKSLSTTHASYQFDEIERRGKELECGIEYIHGLTGVSNATPIDATLVRFTTKNKLEEIIASETLK